MIPYLIINGVSSRNIDGLLVQSLPPITKPKIRTTKEEIDGRDGDMVTKLGYAAYDKTVSIGLKGDYDVDDVIKFFDTSGQVIFSNEIDKYYNFAIYEVIDFNKLIRYKTAKVKMHVQPFKFSADEPPIIRHNANNTTILNLPARNNGNIYSKPKLTITGSGAVNVYIGEEQLFTINLGEDQTVIIDTDEMNATDPQGNYLNRQVIGDYDKFVFPVGLNTITITGLVTSAKLENYSRWI